MTMAMQSQLMSALVDLSHKIWILFYALSDQEESSADTVLRQHIQHLGRVARVRTVVEGQRDRGTGRVTKKENAGMASLQVLIHGAKEWREHLES